MYLGIDIGGTKTLLASFDDDGHIEQTVKFPTSKTYSEFLQNVKQELPKLGNAKFIAAGAGIPGNLDRQKGVVTLLGNLPWKNEPIKANLSEITNCPVVIENDAKMAGYYEAKLFPDFRKVLYLTIGTGIGIAVIENGVIDTAKYDSGGSHMLVDHNGKQEVWEGFAAGPAIVRQYGKKAREITDVETWRKIANDLAIGIKQLLIETKPNAVIIGGGVGSHFDKFGKMLENDLKNSADLNIPPIFEAKRPEEAVIYGCYELAKASHEQTSN